MFQTTFTNSIYFCTLAVYKFLHYVICTKVVEITNRITVLSLVTVDLVDIKSTRWIRNCKKRKKIQLGHRIQNRPWQSYWVPIRKGKNLFNRKPSKSIGVKMAGERKKILVGLVVAMLLGIAVYFRLWSIDYAISSDDADLIRFFSFPLIFLSCSHFNTFLLT